MNKTNTNIKESTTKDNVMPMPLDFIKDIVTGNYNQQTDIAYMQFLQSDLYKTLKPYVYMAISEDDYEGSPIYNGYLDKDTIDTIIDKAIYYAEQDNPEIKNIVENIETDELSKNVLLRAVVKSIVLDMVYFQFRPKKSDIINYFNTYVDQIVPDDLLPSDLVSPEVLPMPLAE